MRQEILGSMPITEATDEEENEVDINDTSVNFDGSDVGEIEANMVLVKNSVILFLKMTECQVHFYLEAWHKTGAEILWRG